MVGYSVIKLLNVEIYLINKVVKSKCSIQFQTNMTLLLSNDKSKRCYLDNKSVQIILNYRKGLLYTEKDFESKM